MVKVMKIELDIPALSVWLKSLSVLYTVRLDRIEAQAGRIEVAQGRIEVKVDRVLKLLEPASPTGFSVTESQPKENQ